MQNRPQDHVKVAVYTEQMSAPESSSVYEVIGVMCLGFGMLLSFWLNTSL